MFLIHTTEFNQINMLNPDDGFILNRVLLNQSSQQPTYEIGICLLLLKT